MREILFRGKTEQGEWKHGDLITMGKDNRKGIRNNKTCEFWWVLPETIGQFTGLTDKNGNKIFEGDIIKGRHWTSYKNKKPEEYHLWVVDWSERSGLIVFNNSPTTDIRLSIHDFADFGEVEVIGNIHDNPELLEDKKNA